MDENNDKVIVQDSSKIITQDGDKVTVQDNNEIKIEDNNESKDKKKGPVIIVIFLVLILFGVAGYFVYNKFFKNKVESDNYTKEYYNLNDVKKEKITKEEFLSRVKKYNATCGVIGQKDDDGNPETCDNSNWFNYEAYINNGTPYYMFNAQICDDEGACTDDEKNFEVYNFSEINNVKQIASKVDQYNGVEFAYELNNGDVYYFTPLFDEITIDGSKHDTHLVKLNLPAKLKRFSNVSNGQITYGTEIVLELENNEKYVVEYNYETNKATLTKYDEYYNKYHKFDDSVELSSDEKTLKLSSEILYSNKLNDIINNNKIISDNIKEQEYDGICPQITLNINNERLHFHILQISNTKVFLYTNNDNSDGKKIEVYGLDEEGKLNYAKFFAVDYEDTKNHSLELIKYDVKNIESIALITVSDESNMLTDNKIPNAPYNYAIFKTKDGKYYTDYSFDKDGMILRQVVQKSNNTPAQNVSSVKCGDVDYDFSKDSVNEVKEGTGWSDGGVEIKYALSDKKLMYTLNDVTKQLNDLSCEKLFKYDNGSLSRSNDTNAIAAGICYTGSKYYEIGLTLDPSVGDRPIQATDFIPYADDITNLCK